MLDTFPIPLSTSLMDTAQNIAHNINVQISVGNNIVVKDDKSELPQTYLVKNDAGSFPHPKLKLFNRYAKSHPKIII